MESFWACGIENNEGTHNITHNHNSPKNSSDLTINMREQTLMKMPEIVCAPDGLIRQINKIEEDMTRFTRSLEKALDGISLSISEEDMARCTMTLEEAIDEIHRLSMVLAARDDRLEYPKALKRAVHQVQRRDFNRNVRKVSKVQVDSERKDKENIIIESVRSLITE